jgi:DNA polymerase III delta prime subunit
MLADDRHDVWCEKYRPKFIKDAILPAELKKTAEGYVEQGKLGTIIFSGGAGVGKTTLARCIANELDADFMVINASMENSIDTIRIKVANFASTISFTDSKKITLLDEADYLSPQAQASLRGFIEEYSSNHAIIMTCNFKSRLIEPLHSRSAVFDFKIPKSEKASLAAQFFKRVCQILENENVTYDKKVVAEVVNKFFPDFRRCINELQKYATKGDINSGILVSFTDDSIKDLFLTLKNRKFNDMRKWVAEADLDATQFYRAVYDNAEQYIDIKSMPQLVLLIGQYQYQAAFSGDQEINTAAFCTELMMSNTVWK